MHNALNISSKLLFAFEPWALGLDCPAWAEGPAQHRVDLPVPQAIDDWATRGCGHRIDD
jgi:hypothetical protein